MIERFNERQREIIDLVGRQFMTYPAAAERLSLSTRTVEDYAQKIRDQSGLRVRPRVALIALANNIPFIATDEPHP